MVEEVAAFLELFPAVRILALHDPSCSFSSCMFISDDLIKYGVRYMLRLADPMEGSELLHSILFNNGFPHFTSSTVNQVDRSILHG